MDQGWEGPREVAGMRVMKSSGSKRGSFRRCSHAGKAISSCAN